MSGKFNLPLLVETILRLQGFIAEHCKALRDGTGMTQVSGWTSVGASVRLNVFRVLYGCLAFYLFSPWFPCLAHDQLWCNSLAPLSALELCD